MRKLDLAMSVAAAAVLAAAGLARAEGPITVAGVGGAVMLPDNQTLVVSVTPEATLLYVDTAAEKELKRVDVDFKPTALALQGDKLFAAAAGSSAVHVLDAASGKEVKSVKTPGEPVQSLACHPSKGLLYAANDNNEILAIDPEQGTANKTKGKGQMLAVDSAEGKYVYAGIQKPIRDVLVFERGAGGKVTVSLDKADERALMLKYAVDDQDLKLEEVNDNAAINGRGIALSPDGKLIAMAGGGGWQSKTDPKRIYGVPVFDTTDMQSQSGLVETGPYPGGVAFHPVLSLGATYHAAREAELIIFSTKSFAKKDALKLPKGADLAPRLVFLGFGAKGTKVIYAIAGSPLPNSHGVVGFASLNLKDEDQEALKKAYSK